MNISFAWLKAIAPGLEMDVDEVAEHLATRGAPVEDTEYLGAGLEQVIVARVESVRQHPNADRLSLCEVNNGAETLQVVCGAPIIHEGGYYPFAGVGVTLPGDFTLKRAKIRGEYSNGMLCSEKELGLGRDQGGIMHLTGQVSLGQPLREAFALDDVRLDVEVTPNRGDWLSQVGVAREVAPGGVDGVVLPAIDGAPELDLEVKTAELEITHAEVGIRIDEPGLCYRFLGVIIRGVEVGPSPDWLAQRLRAVGQQPINNVVDATNYVMLEMGNPMHAYDLGELDGSRLIVRKAKDGEKMQTLDGLEHEFDADMLMICDASVPHDIAGIMGGLHSAVTEDTTEILLECALFEPKSIRRTRKALGISTDASYRFERGVDPQGHLPAVMRALEVILATAGGEVDGPILELLPRPWEPFSLTLRLSRVAQVLGVSLDAGTIEDLLRPLGFGVEAGDEGELNVTVPGYRSYDVTREVDLIEEVARTHGYDNFPDDLAPARPTTVPDHPLFQLEDGLRRTLAAAGLLEATNPAFAPRSEGDVELNNPISTEESHLRRALLPALVRRVEYNFARGARDVRFFEIGTVFHSAGPGDPPREDLHVALCVTGRQRPAHWSEDVEAVDFWTLKGLVQETLNESGWEGAAVSSNGERSRADEGTDETMADKDAPDSYSLFVPSTTVGISLSSGESIGAAGQISPDRIDAPAWAGPVWAMELRLPAEPRLDRTPTFRPLPQFPGMDRDLALLVPQNVSAQSVVDCIRGSGGVLLDEVTIFDMYRGEGVADTERSLAFRLRLQAWDRTLTDKEVDRVVGKVIKRLVEDLGVEQRL